MITVKLLIHKNVVVMETDNGVIYNLDAESIYDYLTEGVCVVDDKYLIEDNCLNGLKFSNTPLNLALEFFIKKGQLKIGILDENIGYRNSSGSFNQQDNNYLSNHTLIDGQWYPFAKDDTLLLKEFLSEFNIERLGQITFGTYLRIRNVDQSIFRIRDNVDSEDLARLELFKDVEHIRGLHANLYDYQKVGIRWLNAIVHENLGGILADEMGLGKTLQIIATMLCNTVADSPNLVIARSTLLENWKREFNKFAPDYKVLVHHGSNRTGLYKTFFDYNVVITSYGSIVRDLSIFRMLKWNILTLDEAQDIKTPTARRTIEIKTLDRSASIAVTGTPLENSLLDLWSIMDFAYKNYLCTQKEFENQYMDNEISHYDLEKVVKPLILKREVSNVAQQLPERIVIPVYLTMNKTKLAKYYEIRENIKKQFSKAPSLAAITALRQYCCHPHLRDEFIDQNIFDSCSKYIHLINTIEEIYNRKEKVIIFSSYRKMIDMLVYDLGNRFNIWCSKIDGEVEISKRQCLLDEFQSVNNTAVLVLNPKAAGAGLNITAANHVIHYNPEWNPATEDQASARAYRLGQEKPVTIHRFIYVNTVEEVMDKRLARKRGLAKKIVVGNVGADREDLELILNLGVNN